MPSDSIDLAAQFSSVIRGEKLPLRMHVSRRRHVLERADHTSTAPASTSQIRSLGSVTNRKSVEFTIACDTSSVSDVWWSWQIP